MPYTLRQAAKTAGKDRTTILRAISSGKLSAARDEATGSWLIEPVELHRIYPPVRTAAEAAHPPVRTPMRTGVRSTVALAEIRELQLRLEAAEAGVRLRDEVIADLRRQRDREAEERRQAQTHLVEAQAKLTGLLTANLPTDRRSAASAPAQWRWWRRR